MDFFEYSGRKRAMITVAFICGIASVALSIIYLPFFGFPLACLALTLAFLSKGFERKFNKKQVIAIITALCAIVISVSTTILVVNTFVTNEEYRKDFLEYADTIYGDTYEELYGESFSEQFENLFPGKE